MLSRTQTRDELAYRRSCRSKALAGLAAASADQGDSAILDDAATHIAQLTGGSVQGHPVWVYGQCLRALAQAVNWEPAILQADANSGRFRDAARRRATKALAAEGKAGRWPTQLKAAVAALANLTDPSQVAHGARLLAQTPLSVSSLEARPTGRFAFEPPPAPRPTDPPIHILLSLDGQLIHSPVCVLPNRVYRLNIEARVQNLPDECQGVHVDFLQVLTTSAVEIGSVTLKPGSLSGQTLLQVKGDLNPRDPPLDLVTRAAALLPNDEVRPLSVIGHPRLRISTFDPATAMPRNLPMVARKLQEMAALLDAKIPTLPQQDRDDWFTLAESLLRFADRATQDRQFGGNSRKIPEATFQKELKKHFYADPNIGARLWEATKQAGGITDLGLGEIVLELKVEHDKPVDLAGAVKYVSQAEHYGAAKDRPVSILCVLDDSPKIQPPGVLGNYIDWMFPSSHALTDPRYPAMVTVLIVPIRFPSPSQWSKKPTSQQTKSRSAGGRAAARVAPASKSAKETRPKRVSRGK